MFSKSNFLILFVLITGIVAEHKWNPKKWLQNIDNDFADNEHVGEYAEPNSRQSEVKNLKLKVDELEKIIASQRNDFYISNEQIAELTLNQSNLVAQKNGLETENKQLMAQIEKYAKMEKQLNNIENDWQNYCKNKHEEANRKIVETYGISKNLTNNTQIMYRACRHNNISVVTALLDLGFNIDTPIYDLNNATCLHLTGRNNYVNLATMLINRGANLNAKNNDNDTPTILAASWGKLEVLKILVEKGSDLGVKGIRNNRTALAWARNQNHTKLINYLVSVGAPE